MDGFKFKAGGNASNWNNIYPSEDNTISIRDIAVSSLPVGAPTNAYRYGTLFCITRKGNENWTRLQIYIPDSASHIYARTANTPDWTLFTGTTVAPVSE